MTTKPATWPEDVVARYLTIGGATVDISGAGTTVDCRGCGDSKLLSPDHAARYAQAHAEDCRAMPRPA